MLKTQGRERREEKRRENKRGRRSLGFLSLASLSRTQKCWNWRGSRQGRCRSRLRITGHSAGSGLLLEMLGALCAVGVTHSNHRAAAEWEITALGEPARKNL